MGGSILSRILCATVRPAVRVTVIDLHGANSRIAARAHPTKGAKNVDCVSNSRFLGLADRNNCYVQRLCRSSRFCQAAAFDRKSGSQRVPVESKTFAVDLSSPCSKGTDSRSAGRHSLNGAIFWFRLVSRTCVLLRSERTMLPPRRGHGDLGKVLSLGRYGAMYWLDRQLSLFQGRHTAEAVHAIDDWTPLKHTVRPANQGS
jgi:hypothetical protein